MLIYTENITSRLNYVLDFIFRDVFQEEVELITDPEVFEQHEGAKINYSTRVIEDGFSIPVSGFLGSRSIENVDVMLDASGSIPVLFSKREPTRDGVVPTLNGLGFDLFSAVFFMISRYEEYLDFKPDIHGRFVAENAVAGKNDFLEIPVVDIWIRDFGNALHEQYPDFKLPEVEFRFLPTSDIDIPYAYLHRGKLRTLGARIKAGMKGIDEPSRRKAVLRGEEKDPFDTYMEIKAIHALHNIRPKIFFLTSRYGKFDKSISPGSKAFKILVKQAQSFADTGIHPSYRASGDLSELRNELGTLSSITGEEIICSRQHFLKFRLPESYRNYLYLGIREEYSMGFASHAGFRAGTARPFFFYDLEKEEETELRVFPFQVMDRTLKDYMKLSPEMALDKILKIAGSVRDTGGTLISIWHNDAFSDYGEWKGWKDVYLQMTDILAPWSNT